MLLRRPSSPPGGRASRRRRPPRCRTAAAGSTRRPARGRAPARWSASGSSRCAYSAPRSAQRPPALLPTVHALLGRRRVVAAPGRSPRRTTALRRQARRRHVRVRLGRRECPVEVVEELVVEGIALLRAGSSRSGPRRPSPNRAPSRTPSRTSGPQFYSRTALALPRHHLALPPFAHRDRLRDQFIHVPSPYSAPGAATTRRPGRQTRVAPVRRA